MFLNIKKVFAIACVTVAVGAASVPSSVFAQNTTQNQSANRRPRQGEAFKQLNLTDVQKSAMKQIRENAKIQRQNVFNAEQLDKIAKARQSGDMKGLRGSLNLSADQKQRMEAIRVESKRQVGEVLTDVQKQQLLKMRQARKAQLNNR